MGFKSGKAKTQKELRRAIATDTINKMIDKAYICGASSEEIDMDCYFDEMEKLKKEILKLI